MKSFCFSVGFLMCVFSANCGRLRMPEYLQEYSCHKSEPEYAKCLSERFEKAKPFFVKGIPELGVPPMDPFRISSFSVNRTLNQLVSINAVCTDVEVTGMKNTIITGVKADPENGIGEMRATIPWVHAEMDYDVSGQLLIVPLQSKGHFQGNFTDTQMVVKCSFKKFLKDGIEYFKINKLDHKITIGSGQIKLSSQDKDFQYAADLITEFFNENPRRVLDAVNPIFIEFMNTFSRQEYNRILAKIPASEWIPE